MSPINDFVQSTDYTVVNVMDMSENTQKLSSTEPTTVQKLESEIPKLSFCTETDGQQQWADYSTICGPSCSSKFHSGESISKHFLSVKLNAEDGDIRHSEYLCMSAGRKLLPERLAASGALKTNLDNGRAENVACTLAMMSTVSEQSAGVQYGVAVHSDAVDAMSSDEDDYLTMNSIGTTFESAMDCVTVTPPNRVNVSPPRKSPVPLPKQTLETQRSRANRKTSGGSDGARDRPFLADDDDYLIMEQSAEVTARSVEHTYSNDAVTMTASLRRPVAAVRRYSDPRMRPPTINSSDTWQNCARMSRKIGTGTSTVATRARKGVRTTTAIRSAAAIGNTVNRRSSVSYGGPAVGAPRYYCRPTTPADVNRIMARPLPATPVTRNDVEVTRQRLPVHDSDTGREVMTNCMVIKVISGNVIVVTESQTIQGDGEPAVSTEAGNDASRRAETSGERKADCCCCTIM